MYNEGGGAAVGGGGATAGGLAVTGISVMGLAILAFALILLGVVIVRMATVRRRRSVESPPSTGVDPFAALASAVAATSGTDV